MFRCFTSRIIPVSTRPVLFRTASRYSERRLGPGRSRAAVQGRHTQKITETISSEGTAQWAPTVTPEDPHEALQQLLLGNETLIVERQLEMLNIFIGFEQCNRYAINNTLGETVGYITEEPGSFLASFGRQLFGTHRPFRAMIMDVHGRPLLWLRRPFAWINSRMYVQRRLESGELGPDGEPVLDTFAEVQQVWHLIRRRYDMFLRDSPNRILSLASESQPTPEPSDSIFSQFAKVDSGFLAWTFKLRDGKGEDIALVTRSFRGFGREIFTDTGMYAIHFNPPLEEEVQKGWHRKLSLEERALTLALAVNIDFDYFSRHSGAGLGSGFFHID
ncbi:Scramblase-domain-containing protein [Mycena floridula]|nr:Scramblase-domain-containing protein [Mycena floridula]